MTIRYVTGDATAPERVPYQGRMIVHCCNDLGLWGAGFVLALDKLSPEPKRVYLQQNPYNLGDVSYANAATGLWVANIIGQHGTKSTANPHPIKYDAIHDGLTKVVRYVGSDGFSLHMPRMGAGLAGGSWPVIAAIIEETCGDVPVTVYDLPVKLEPRWGALTTCGCWHYALAGSSVGRPLTCPIHGNVQIDQCNVVEPPEGPGFTKVDKFWSCCDTPRVIKVTSGYKER